MNLVFVTGGARSGKSRYAEALATYWGSGGVTYVATLNPSDEEMMRRIAQHRGRRPSAWHTVETRFEVAETVQGAKTDIILLDCLSGFVSNLLLAHEDRGEVAVLSIISDAVEEVLEAVQTSQKTVIMVTNEVGSGVVPAYALGRWYRDALGMANVRVAQAADAVVLMSVGIAQSLKGTLPEVTGGQR